MNEHADATTARHCAMDQSTFRIPLFAGFRHEAVDEDPASDLEMCNKPTVEVWGAPRVKQVPRPVPGNLNLQTPVLPPPHG